MKKEKRSRSHLSDINTELAKARNRAAADRTTLAWIRTSLALISFGFGLDQVISAIHTMNAHNSANESGVHLVSIAFIAVGIFTLAVAAKQHKLELSRLNNIQYTYREQLSLPIATAIASLIIGGITLSILLYGL